MSIEVPVYHLENVVRHRSEMENFDGPLDLILALLSKNKMEIQDIQISLILEQYMEWMQRRKELDLDVASEFVTMASQLVYIKTRMLLSINDEETISEMEELVAALEERKCSENYTKIRAILPSMQTRYQIGCDALVRGQLPITPDKTYHYTHSAQDLLQAMTNLIQRGGHTPPQPEQAFEGIVGREPYPVGEKAKEVLAGLVRNGITHLQKLILSAKSRSEIVATFLAVLELCKNHRIHLVGSGGACTVTSVSGEKEIDDVEKE